MKTLYLILLTGFIFSCDFTPKLYKNIKVAQNYLLSQQYEDAVREYQLILDKSPAEDVKVKIVYQLAEIYSINLAQSKIAADYFESLKNITQNPLWLVKSEDRLGEIYFSELNDFKKSLVSYKKLKNFVPDLERKYFYEFRYALSQLNLNEYLSAEGSFKKIKAQKNHEYYLESIYQLGLIKFHQKKFQSAVNIWKGYIKKEKRKNKTSQVKFLIANAYETMEDLKKAYIIYYSILDDYPNPDIIKNRLKSIYERRVARKR